MSTIIQLQNFGKTYGNTVAVKNVSFSVEQGEIFGLLGPKTTMPIYQVGKNNGYSSRWRLSTASNSGGINSTVSL